MSKKNIKKKKKSLKIDSDDFSDSKKEFEISQIRKAIEKLTKTIEKKIDEREEEQSIKTNVQEQEPIPGIADTPTVDYGELFSYLGKLSANIRYDYANYDDLKIKVEDITERNVHTETISTKSINDIIEKKKMSDIMGVESYDNPSEKEAYKWFAVFNKGLTELRYQLSFT